MSFTKLNEQIVTGNPKCKSQLGQPIPMRHLFILMVILTSSLCVFAQRTILSSSLTEYGANMEFEEVWTDDDYIVMLGKGTIKGATVHTFFLIHPERGIQSTYTVKKSGLRPHNLICASPESITIFYSSLEGKTYCLTFSKTSSETSIQETTEKMNRVEKEALFSFMLGGRFLFASVTKDKSKFAFRELLKTGEDKIVYLFDLPQPLLKYLKGSSGRKFEQKGFIYDNLVRAIGKYVSGNQLILDVFEFDLSTQKISINTTTQNNKYKSFSATFAGDNIFLLKSNNGISEGKNVYELYLDVLKYPSFDFQERFICTEQAGSIPFKSSHINQITFKTGLYHSGRNKDFSDLEDEGVTFSKTLQAMGTGETFITANQTVDGNFQLMVGSHHDILITNTVKTTISYFFGCLDKNFKPCEEVLEKSKEEKRHDYLKSIQKEKPEYTAFGYRKAFLISNLKERKEIEIKQF